MFELSPNIDKNKIFLVNLSEIEGRLDPVMLLYQRKINNYSFNLVPIKNLLLSNPQYGANEAGIDRLNNKEPRYIRITDIDENGNLIDELGKTAKKVEQQYFLEHNDIIIARSGNTVGKSYIHKSKKINYPCFFAGYMIRFKFNPEIIYPDYAFIVTQLNFYKEWLNAVRRLAGQPNINAEEYKSFKIPLPPKEIQQKIINLYETAYKTKQQKEAEAERLLNSIDDYLLGELGITLPEKDNSLENRIFKVNFSEITGGRFDPYYNDIYYLEVIKHILNGRYKPVNIKDLCYSVSGVVYSGKDERKKGKAILRANNIDLNTNELNFDDIRYIRDDIEIPEELKLKKNDILMSSASGSKEHVGKVAYINQDLNYYFGGFMMVLRSKSNIYKQKYLFEFLQSNLFRTYLFRILGGTNINNLNFSMLSNLLVPLPPLEKQNVIAKHIKAIREQAKQLKSEAKEVLEQAKQEVEQMILGE